MESLILSILLILSNFIFGLFVISSELSIKLSINIKGLFTCRIIGLFGLILLNIVSLSFSEGISLIL